MYLQVASEMQCCTPVQSAGVNVKCDCLYILFQNLEIPSKFEASVVYTNSPTEFWLQCNSDEDDVLNISAQLAEHSNSSAFKPLMSPVVGQYCAAKYNEDMAWYRARVLESYPGGAKVCLLLSYHTESFQ